MKILFPDKEIESEEEYERQILAEEAKLRLKLHRGVAELSPNEEDTLLEISTLEGRRRAQKAFDEGKKYADARGCVAKERLQVASNCYIALKAGVEGCFLEPGCVEPIIFQTLKPLEDTLQALRSIILHVVAIGEKYEKAETRWQSVEPGSCSESGDVTLSDMKILPEMWRESLEASEKVRLAYIQDVSDLKERTKILSNFVEPFEEERKAWKDTSGEILALRDNVKGIITTAFNALRDSKASSDANSLERGNVSHSLRQLLEVATEHYKELGAAMYTASDIKDKLTTRVVESSEVKDDEMLDRVEAKEEYIHNMLDGWRREAERNHDALKHYECHIRQLERELKRLDSQAKECDMKHGAKSGV